VDFPAVVEIQAVVVGAAPAAGWVAVVGVMPGCQTLLMLSRMFPSAVLVAWAESGVPEARMVEQAGCPDPVERPAQAAQLTCPTLALT